MASQRVIDWAQTFMGNWQQSDKDEVAALEGATDEEYKAKFREVKKRVLTSE